PLAGPGGRPARRPRGRGCVRLWTCPPGSRRPPTSRPSHLPRRWCPVSVAEIASRDGDFERTPPHDLAAEQGGLGGVVMSNDAISDVMEVIRPADHYRPAHQIVHEAILELYGRGEPADPVTVSDLLAKRGELARVGGGAYLHTLIASVPTAANAGYYARI